jgi:predicted Zn-dependent protease
MIEKKDFNIIKKHITITSLAIAMAVSPLAVPTAQAFGLDGIIGGVVNGAMGTSQIYSVYLRYLLAQGNSASNQDSLFKNDIKTKGADPNSDDVVLVDKIMNQLVNKSEYILDKRSLPFRWGVNNSTDFNASCFASDYVSINAGMLKGLNYNEDEIAAILGHEMTHGIKQHTAHNAARELAQEFGMGLINQGGNALKQKAVEVLTKYSNAKNITLPSEHEADEGGFYLMTSAGYNPGGAPAAMSRMQYFTKHIADFSDIFTPADHPNTDVRLQKMSELMSEYGYNHVVVKDTNKIYIDDKLLLQAEAANPYDSEEMAYFIAGGIAKGFHDNHFATSWYFKKTNDGMDFLNNDPVYTYLKEAIAKNNLGDTFNQMVENAYSLDTKTGTRSDLYAKELERKADLEKQKKKNAKASPEEIDEMYKNAKVYIDIDTNLAFKEANRIIEIDPNNKFGYASRARIYAAVGDFEKGMEDCNKTIAIAPNDPVTYTSRAYVSWKQGDVNAAIADCNKSIALNKDFFEGYKFLANIYDNQDDYDNALINYRKYKMIDANASIPEKYASALN